MNKLLTLAGLSLALTACHEVQSPITKPSTLFIYTFSDEVIDRCGIVDDRFAEEYELNPEMYGHVYANAVLPDHLKPRLISTLSNGRKERLLYNEEVFGWKKYNGSITGAVYRRYKEAGSYIYHKNLIPEEGGTINMKLVCDRNHQEIISSDYIKPEYVGQQINIYRVGWDSTKNTMTLTIDRVLQVNEHGQNSYSLSALRSQLSQANIP